MATRLLLTLLALLTGLAAQFAPAQARVCPPADTQIGAVARAGAIQIRADAVALRALPAQPGAVHLPLLATTGPVTCQARPATVLQGIDRARE